MDQRLTEALNTATDIKDQEGKLAQSVRRRGDFLRLLEWIERRKITLAKDVNRDGNDEGVIMEAAKHAITEQLEHNEVFILLAEIAMEMKEVSDEGQH